MSKVLELEVAQYKIKGYESIEQAVDEILESYLGVGATAVAINPEKVMLARKDDKIKSLISNFEIKYADGVGITWAIKRKHNEKVSRIPGCELWESLMLEAGNRDKRVFLLGATQETLLLTREKLKQQFNVNVVGISNGYFEDSDAVIDKILALKPDILTVAMGSPKQEEFIQKCKSSGVKSFMMGVGGTYDVFTGKVKRAPKLFIALKLEWFYRLVTDLSRLKRQTSLLGYLALMINNRL